mgnify:CR=1 FL=1
MILEKFIFDSLWGADHKLAAEAYRGITGLGREMKDYHPAVLVALHRELNYIVDSGHLSVDAKEQVTGTIKLIYNYLNDPDTEV